MPIVEAKSPYDDNGKPSVPGSSQDGQGGTTPSEHYEVPDMKAGARHIYYRLYTKDGPLESNRPIYSNDRFTSRISSRSLRPPQTSGLLKKYLCKIEGIGSFENSVLYQSLSEKTVMEDSTHLSFKGSPGPGSSGFDPMALVVDGSAAKKRSQVKNAVDPPKLLERDYEQRYVYYLVYDEDSEAVSKTSFDENNPCLGRVDTLSIPPPHTVSSLKYHLIKSEEILGHNVQLYEDEGSESTMHDDDSISLFADLFPGFSEDQPLAMVYESQRFGTTTTPVDKEDPNEILMRDLHEARSALEESNEKHARELAQVREELEEMKKTHARELHQARSALDRLKSDDAHARVVAFEAGASPSQLQALSESPSFTKKFIARGPSRLCYETQIVGICLNPEWLDPQQGDILYSDGLSKRETFMRRFSQAEFDCYLVIDVSGRLGIVEADTVELIVTKGQSNDGIF